MNFRVQIIFNFNSVLKNFAEKIINKKMFILTSPIGGKIYYVDFHNTRYITNSINQTKK
jgi:hypothetical protein